MGACTGNNNQKSVYKVADQVFDAIDTENKKQFNAQDLQKYFQLYSKIASKIIMRQMDAKNNGVITKDQWFAYWQFIKRSGYTDNRIIQQLMKLKNGIVQLDFPQAKQYSYQHRSTAIKKILEQVNVSKRLTINGIE